MKKNLRPLAIALLILLLLLALGGLYTWKNKPGFLGGSSDIGSDVGATAGLDELGDPLDESGSSPLPPGVSENELYSSVLKQMLECLDIEAPPKVTAQSVQVEGLLNLVEPSLGKAQVVERWKAWHLRDAQKRERRVRLEVVENDEGQISREMHYFGVDKDGQLQPLELDPRDVMNPSDQTIQSLLSKGEVFYQETAHAGLFAGGERIEYINKNGKLAEIEFLKSDRVFACQSVLRSQTCVCTK